MATTLSNTSLREVTKNKIKEVIEGIVYSQAFGSKVHSYYHKQAERMYKKLNPIRQGYWAEYLDSISPIKREEI